MHKTLQQSEEDVGHLLSMSENILDSIMKLSSSNVAAVTSIMYFTNSKQHDLMNNLDMLIETHKWSLNTGEREDADTLQLIKKAMSDGLLIQASVLMTEINDEIIKDFVFSDFKEMNVYARKAEILISNSPERGKKLSAELSYIKEDGLIDFKNIDKFNNKDFMDAFLNSDMEKKAEEPSTKTSSLPDFEEEHVSIKR